MSKPKMLFLVVAALLIGTHPVRANAFAVGTCQPHLQSYPTISAAVAAVPPGSTVLVCPGTYGEQITISQPLTLEGVSSANSSDVIIAVPASGLNVITDSYGQTIATQVAVTAGPVNISNITVDGTGANVGGYPTFLDGILYESGSSGTISRVTIRNLSDSGAATGIYAENSNPTEESVTIENSSFHDIDNSAVIVLTNSPPTLNATVTGNTMESSINVQWLGPSGNLTGNVIRGGLIGIYLSISTANVSGNVVTDSSEFGIWAPFQGGVSATSNKISNSGTGINFTQPGDTFTSNVITQSQVGIEFNCIPATVSGNTINEAGVGIDGVPASFTGTNGFVSVGTVRNGCSSDVVPKSKMPKPSGPGPIRAPID